MKYSVIIPVYKAEKTIRKCVESLLNQMHDDVEILLINDGSPDNCGLICKEYAQYHSCIKYYEKENGGVSSARNVGLREAMGDYILFVDSDDYVSSDYFSKINIELEKYQPDMLLFGVYYGNHPDCIWSVSNYIVTGQIEVAKKIRKAVKAYLFSNLMSKTFDKKIIDKYKIRFDESLAIGEDQSFVFEYALHIKSIASISDGLYYYADDNSDSLSHKRREYLSEQLLKGNLEMLSSLNMLDCSPKVKKNYLEAILWTHYRSAYSACKELLKFDLTRKERREKIRKICKMYTIEEMKPMCFESWIIAFPIIYQMSFLIDLLAIRNYKKDRFYNNKKVYEKEGTKKIK